MKKQPTELKGVKEIARRANVSIATVDRVLHNRPGVSKETKDKINEIIVEFNYQPNLLAKRLASRKTIRLATLIPKESEETTYWEAPLSGIVKAEAEVNQFGIIIEKYFYDQNSALSFTEQANLILESAPEGILLAPSFVEEAVDFTNRCKEANIPFVLINSDLPDQDSLSYIGPELYQSGYLAAQLISYLIKEGDKILIVNISKELHNRHHLHKKEEGTRAYFTDHHQKSNIIKVDIKQTDYAFIEQTLAKTFADHPDIRVVFVTNSRVSKVARYIEGAKKDTILIGYDYLQENIDYMNKDVIDFLICQKPKDQAYRGVISLYKYLAFSLPVERVHFMPIDILTKVNYPYYQN
ncbi:MAG: LacI family DNA-binding transcriptional regulator [Bacteroidota bacterium]